MLQAARTALVTGGAKRIGRAIVENLAAHGFGVVIHCNRSRADADALAAAIRGKGGEAAVVTADLSEQRAVGGLIDQATATLGPIGLLVNNASVFEPDTADDFEWEVWDRHFALHLKAPAMLTRNLAAALPPNQEGLVVNIVDQRVWKPTPHYFSYTLSKSSLWDATRTMAQSFAPRLRVNAIGPGPTLANIRQSAADFEAQAGSVLLGRGPSLDEFGATIRYLWETRSITGQMIAIDGGQHLAWETPDVTGNE
ncbi:SDR family oxidoreductase [Arvimicrobium flavum]|uniref:SDR family oxidoreductase n=1 Tax=Arvimicrobium flavum TaxID=3393320 RepID=UPI00237A81AD|nr:SDR family oxidoreductase [Mesorhizobium shangrilense]